MPAAGARLRAGAHAIVRQHCRNLWARPARPELAPTLVLAGLAAEQIQSWVHDQNHDLVDLVDPIDLASALASAAIALTQQACS